MRKALRRDYHLWLMVLPAIMVIFVFNYIPMYGIQLAFREYKFSEGMFGGEWVGLKYFAQFFKSPMAFKTIWNTFYISLINILVGFPAPIILALLFNQVKLNRVKKVLQTTVYIPNFISTVVMVAIINLFLSSNGMVYRLLTVLGIIAPDANLLGSATYFPIIYVLSGVWQTTGWNSIIYLAALSNVDTQLYDAAKIDGANRLRLIWHIDIPVLIPTIIVLLILNMGSLLSVGFEKVFLMQNALNIETSEVISTFTYKIGVYTAKFSYGTAVGLFNTIVNFLLLMLSNFAAKKVSDISII